MKFSTSWCQKALPAAKEIYLKDLPACYPTSLHTSHLEKALQAFHSMVKGPTVKFFRKKLEDECITIWRSGRQLCDAISLTGKSCMHQRHNVEVGDSFLEAEVKPHSSGFLFLHACACGRSHWLRDDPFEFEKANVTFNHLPKCDDLLPALQLPKVSHSGPISPSSWSLVRVGGALYYQPSKGLLQSGFCSTEKFLLKWVVFLGKLRTCLPVVAARKVSFINSHEKLNPVSVTDEETKKVGSGQLLQEARNRLMGNQRPNLNSKSNSQSISSEDKKINFGRGLSNFTMRRPFAEVVAGSKATNAAFPPLQQRKLPVLGSEKGIKQKIARVRSEKQINIVDDLQESQISENISSARDSSNVTRADSFSDGNSSSQMRSKAVPATMSDGGKIKTNFSPKHVIVYVGFEHECSYGHRFLLNSEHLNELGPLYSLPEEMQASSSIKCSDGEATDSINISKNRANEKVLPRSNGLVTAINNVRPLNKLKQKMATGNQHWDGWDGFSSFSTSENEHNQFSNGLSSRSKSFNDLEEKLQQVSLDDSASAFSLLNRNLPVYMNCPHCRVSKRKDQQKAKFASTVSQLQRIFLV